MPAIAPPIKKSVSQRTLQKLQENTPWQNVFAAAVTVSGPVMRKISECYRADYRLADGRHGVVFYNLDHRLITWIQSIARERKPVWVEPIAQHPKFKTWRVEVICSVGDEVVH